MRNLALLILAVGMSLFTLAFGQTVYRWVDEKGTAHFTDDLTLVPEKYRNQIQQKVPSQEAPPSPSPSSNLPVPSSTPSPASPYSPPPTSPFSPDPSRPGEAPRMMEPQKAIPGAQEARQKDMLGRGEEWWRATMRDWNQKFVTYRTNYENAFNEWKAKEQELEEAKFKPDSLKRKLRADSKVLEDKANDWEKLMNEAKKMIEVVLPKQARDYQANPEWLKIEEKK